MFWGCFWQDELGPLVALPKGSIDSVKYGEILEEHGFPFYMAVQGVLEEDPWLMEDNCRVHKSAASTALKDELGIRTLEWPSYSPDLNPIEALERSCPKIQASTHQSRRAHRSCFSSLGRVEDD